MITFKKTLLEKNRQELLSKQRKEAPKRVKRADAYSVSAINIDPNALINNWLVITSTISGNGRSYTDSIAFKNIMTDLIEQAKNDVKHYVNSKLILKSIKQSLDSHDVYIDCSCPDFKYRYAYFSTQDNFKWGKLQNSNGKKIRNPNNNIGSMCKHLYALLRSNKFLNSVSDKIMRTIMANIDVLYKQFNFDLNEFIVNTDRYDRMLKNNSRTSTGQFIKKSESIKLEASNNDTYNNSIVQYYCNSQIIELFKEQISEDDYLAFIKKYGKKNEDKSLEDYLINNISNVKLLNYIKEFDNSAWNDIINSMINISYKEI